MGGLGGRLVGGVLADHRENGIGVQVVQSRYGIEAVVEGAFVMTGRHCAFSDHIGLRAWLS